MDIINKVVGAVTGGNNSLMSSVMGMLSGGSGPGNGIGALMEKFTQNGLGAKVQSWVGQGENQEVSAEEISNALGQEQIQAMAQESGMEPNEVAAQLSKVLPQAVDQATPDGKAPEGAFDIGSLTSMLGGLFGGKN